QLSSVAMISRLAQPQYRGQALGLYNAIAGLGTIIAGVSSGLMAQHLGYGTTFLTSGILAAAAVLVVARLPIPRRATKRVPEPENNKRALVHMRAA
ncbi:MAG: MFS transporter, partial [Candidatus Bipolaricaulota bacterium]|nr:MFS transporter [Candidatus Bipolaricaulota bacterium]